MYVLTAQPLLMLFSAVVQALHKLEEKISMVITIHPFWKKIVWHDTPFMLSLG